MIRQGVGRLWAERVWEYEMMVASCLLQQRPITRVGAEWPIRDLSSPFIRRPTLDLFEVG